MSTGLEHERTFEGFSSRDHARAVTASAIGRYADSIGDPDPGARRGDLSIAPPLFPSTLVADCFAECLTPVLREPSLRGIVHVGQEFETTRGLRANEETLNRGRLVGARRARGSTILTCELETWSGSEPVARARATVLAVGVELDREFGWRRRTDPTVERGPGRRARMELPSDQALQYAMASGDDNPVHRDPTVARAVGFEDVVVHGLCVLGRAAVALAELVDAGRRGRVVSLAGRFAEPAYDGDHLDVLTWESGGRRAFEVRGSRGIVVKRGRVVVASSTNSDTREAG